MSPTGGMRTKKAVFKPSGFQDRPKTPQKWIFPLLEVVSGEIGGGRGRVSLAMPTVAHRLAAQGHIG